MIAEAVTLEGETEAILQESFAKKRAHTELLAQIESMASLSKNDKSVVFGVHSNNLLAQVEAFNLVQAQDQPNSKSGF